MCVRSREMGKNCAQGENQPVYNAGQRKLLKRNAGGKDERGPGTSNNKKREERKKIRNRNEFEFGFVHKILNKSIAVCWTGK